MTAASVAVSVAATAAPPVATVLLCGCNALRSSPLRRVMATGTHSATAMASTPMRRSSGSTWPVAWRTPSVTLLMTGTC